MKFKLVEKEQYFNLWVILHQDMSVYAEPRARVTNSDYNYISVESFNVLDLLVARARQTLEIPEDVVTKHSVRLDESTQSFVVKLAWIEEELESRDMVNVTDVEV